MEFKHRLFHHLKAVQEVCQPLRCEANLNVNTMRLDLRRGEESAVLQPQFLVFKDGKRGYTPRFTPDTRMFIGWLPYFNRRWELANSKLRFKEYCVKNDIRTPEFSTTPGAAMTNVVAKHDQSSFGYSLYGPFRTSSQHKLQSGEFYEAFIAGRIAKIWFWNDQPVAMETQDMPFVFGTGADKVRELMVRQMRFGERVVPEDLDAIAKDFRDYMGVKLDEVPPRGTKVHVDFRYGSPFYIRRFMENVVFPSEKYAAVEADLRRTGTLLYNGINPSVRLNSVYTVDAVIDAEGRVWYLEMNSNPFVHPAVYVPMISALIPKTDQPAVSDVVQTMPTRLLQ